MEWGGEDYIGWFGLGFWARLKKKTIQRWTEKGAEDDPNDKADNTSSVGRMPCVIYGYESAVHLPIVIDNSKSASTQW